MRGLFERFRRGFDGPGGAILAEIMEEMIAATDKESPWEINRTLSSSARWEKLKSDPPDVQMDVAVAAIRANKRGTGGSGGWEYWARREVPVYIASQLLRRKKLAFDVDRLCEILRYAKVAPSLDWGFPLASLLGACERHCDGSPAQGPVRAGLESLKKKIKKEDHLTQTLRKAVWRIDEILSGPGKPSELVLPEGGFASKLGEWLQAEAQEPQSMRPALVRHLVDGSQKTKPTKAWLKSAEALLKGDLRGQLEDQLLTWLSEEVPDPAEPDDSHEFLKTLIWLSPLLTAGRLVPTLGQFAQLCYRKVPQIGARSIKLGNACLLTLEAMADSPGAVAELVRLNRDIKYPSARKQITERLSRIAEARGISPDDLADQSLPTYDLSQDGRAEVPMGDYVASLVLTANDVTLAWATSDGKARKTVPKAVREGHGETLKQTRARVKEIDGARKSTIARLESSWINGTDWSLQDWQAQYERHPLRRPIVQSLVWRITQGDETLAMMPRPDGWVDANGRPVSAPKEGRVSLWHPLDETPEDVLAWRRQILSAELTQPIKQAHREVYVLTDAERETEVYSNRFAAHILRQHQFRALCNERDWRYELMGMWDSHNIPSRPIPSRDLTAEYQVEMAEGGGESEMGIALHLASDQVCFLDAEQQRVPLADVPPIVFSELMRDVDLFVAVTSVANDPNWTDGGPEGRFGTYWEAHAFGDLSQTAQSRKELLEELLPKLAISKHCQIDGKFLVVTGKRSTYRIHLGSSNIQMLPNNRYLCIVPGRSTGKQVRLPFVGDGILSIILSKAHLLANDDKITDRTILSQMGR